MSPEQPSNKIGKSVGEKLRAARVAQHYTQSQLAAPDFSVSYISAIERGQIHPSLRALEILAGRLGLTSTQLLPNRSQQDERLGGASSVREHDEDEVEFLFLQAQILILQGEEEIAKVELETLDNQLLKRPLQLQHSYLLSWAYYNLGRYQQSESILTEAVELAKELNNHYINVRILNLLALTSGAMRNYTQALQLHQRCLRLAEEQETPDPFLLIQIYLSIGQHNTRLGDMEATLQALHKALKLADGLTTTLHIQETYAVLCRFYAEQKNPILATLYAYKSTQLHNQDTLRRLRSEIYHYLSQAMLQGDQEKARIYIDETLLQSDVQYDELALASLTMHNALWYFKRLELDDASKHIKEAQELAHTFGDTIIAAETLILHGQIAYAQKQYEEGDRNFIAGLDMRERLGNHEELANESVQYAELLEKIGKEHEAFTYFRRAFQSQQKLGR